MTVKNSVQPFYNENEIGDNTNFVIPVGSDPKQHFGAFAKGYYLAASKMAEHLIAQTRFCDYEAYPVIFLYRHSLELYLKNVLYKTLPLTAFRMMEKIDAQANDKHRLVPLVDKVQIVIQKLFPNDHSLRQVTQRMSRVTRELSDLDPGSYTYRYPIDNAGNSYSPPNQMVNLRSFAKTMNEVLHDLEAIDFGFDIETDKAEEIWRHLQTIPAHDESGQS